MEAKLQLLMMCVKTAQKKISQLLNYLITQDWKLRRGQTTAFIALHFNGPNIKFISICLIMIK